MSGQYFNLSTSDFDAKLKKLITLTMPPLVAKGQFNAASEAMRDADKEAPQTPKKSGDLRGSKKIESAKTSFKDTTTTFGFNIEYASRVHEAEPGTIRFVPRGSITQPGSKFLETKLVRNHRKYMEIVAETIKRGL